MGRRSFVVAWVSLLLLALTSACTGARCGTGTVMVAGVCVIEVRDDGTDTVDAAPRVDGSGDANAIPEITAVELRMISPWASENGFDPAIPVGGIVEITARGLTAAREWVPLPASVLRTEGSAVVARAREPIGDRPSRLSVVGIAPGTARVIGSVVTPSGTREAEAFVVVEQSAEPLTLACASAQDYPAIFAEIENILARNEAAAIVPVDLSARVLCAIGWTSRQGRAIRQPLSPEDYVVAVSSGPGRIEERSIVRGTASGLVNVVGTYAPEGATVVSPTDSAQVRYVDDVPVTALGIGYTYAPSQISSTPAGATPAVPAWDPSRGGAIYLDPGSSTELAIVSWHVITATERYFRPVPFAEVTPRVLPTRDAVDLDAAGRLTWRMPGVALLSLVAHGLEISPLVASRFPATNTVTLRADPASIALTVLSRSSACATVRLLLSVDGIERPMTDLELRALGRHTDLDSPFAHSFVDAATPDPTEFCLDSAQRFSGEPATWTNDAWITWIQAPGDFARALRVPVAISW